MGQFERYTPCTLGPTPAMAAGVANRPWKVEDVLARMDPDTLLHATYDHANRFWPACRDGDADDLRP